MTCAFVVRVVRRYTIPAFGVLAESVSDSAVSICAIVYFHCVYNALSLVVGENQSAVSVVFG